VKPISAEKIMVRRSKGHGTLKEKDLLELGDLKN